MSWCETVNLRCFTIYDFFAKKKALPTISERKFNEKLRVYNFHVPNGKLVLTIGQLFKRNFM